MGVISMLALAAVPLLLVNLAPQLHVKATSIAIPNFNRPNPYKSVAPPSGGAPRRRANGEQAGRNQTEVVARYTALRAILKQVSPQEMMVLVCDGLQSLVTECAQIPKFSEFMRSNEAAFKTESTGRRKRFASSSFNDWFGSSFNSNSGLGSSNYFNTNFNPWPSNSSYNSFYNNNNNNNQFGSNSYNNAIICPAQTDQSAIYQLSGDSEGYPAGDIGNELNSDPAFRDCLLREIVLSTDAPSLMVEDFRTTANVTCPFTQLRLWSYQSLSASAMCWILQNFQENILYRICSSTSCNNCKDKQSSFNYGTSTNLNQKLCIKDFNVVSVWAFCPSLPLGQRIIRDRIIIPVFCSCQSVACEAIPQWKKK